MNKTRQFVRPDLDTLPQYKPAPGLDPTRVLKLDANENPYGASPRAREALARIQTWNVYPLQDELRAALAQYVNVQPDNVVVTNGADEAIEIVLRATLEPDDCVIDCPPSFEMYPIHTLIQHGRLIEIPRREDFSPDVVAVEQAQRETKAKVIFLASPNNPDGSLLPRNELVRMLALDALIVLDEAYAEFADVSMVDSLAQHENLVVLRTFSKWAGLAGLRVGYAIAPPPLAGAMHKVRSPYNVNAAGLHAALASLEDKEYLMANVQRLVAERERMFVALSRSNLLQPLPSHTNFLLCRVRGPDGQRVKQELFARGILIRAFDSPRLREYVRITIGLPEQNERVLTALREIGEVAETERGGQTVT